MATRDPIEICRQINDFPQDILFKVINILFPELAPREAECLYWISFGTQNAEIADIMNITEDSVKSYTKNCRRKLHVSTSSALRAIYHCRLDNFLLKKNLIN